MKTFGFITLLSIFWILLSGHFEPLLLGLGITSIVLTVFIAKRMELIDDEIYSLHLFSQLPSFFAYIFKEIVKANLDVIKRIIKPASNPISPQLITISMPKKSDIGRVIYANSVTLTPGTVSVELSKDKLTIHALTKEAAKDLIEGSMASKIPDSEIKK